MTDRDALVVLNAIAGMGTVHYKRLEACFGSAAAILEQKKEALLDCGGINPQLAQNIIDFSKDKFLEDEYNHGRKLGLRIMTAVDEEFPKSLADIPGGPLVLYVKGQADLLHHECVAVVGSRVCSAYGVATAERFAAQLGRVGLVIVSGLARGIDTAAHQGCLKAGGATIAVLGCGLRFLYPKENRRLFEAISAQGAVISEMPLATPPLPMHFPRRNRVISGLSLGVVVIDAGEQSGALITAGFASEQGKDVFAVPCNIDYETGQGSNRLIKDGAIVALSAEDVLRELKGQLQWKMEELKSGKSQALLTLQGRERQVFDLMSSEPKTFDDLLSITSMGVSEISATLLNLELKKAIRHVPGQGYMKNPHHG